MSWSSIDVGTNQRKLFFMLSNHSNNYFSYMNTYFDLQIFVFLDSPFEHFSLFEHLLSHTHQTFNFISFDHLVFHLIFYFLDSWSSHIGITHCFYFLDCKAWTNFVEFSIKIIKQSYHISSFLLNNRIEITYVAEKDCHTFLLILSIFSKEVSHEFRHQNSPNIICLVCLHFYLLPLNKIFPWIESTTVKHSWIDDTTQSHKDDVKGHSLWVVINCSKNNRNQSNNVRNNDKHQDKE